MRKFKYVVTVVRKYKGESDRIDGRNDMFIFDNEHLAIKYVAELTEYYNRAIKNPDMTIELLVDTAEVLRRKDF